MARNAVAKNAGLIKRLKILVWLAALPSACMMGCASQGPVWSYEGATGPAAWSTLDPAYGTCGSGRNQSPINIEEVLPRDLPNLQFRYLPTPVRLRNTGRNVEQAVQPGSTLGLGKIPYELQSLRFHAPSEHRAAGQEFALEMQWTHKNAQGYLAIVAVMVKVGRENLALKPMLKRLPMAADEQVEASDVVALDKLLPTQRTYLRYSGSQTEPPCWENVIWLILTEPIEASAAQIASFKRIHPNNVRPANPLGKRQVFLDAMP